MMKQMVILIVIIIIMFVQKKMNDVAWLEKAKKRTLTVSELAWLGFMY